MNRVERTISRNIVAAFLGLLGVILVSAVPSYSEIIRTDSDNEYLQREFDWAMFLDLQEQPHLLKYQSSSLNPLTKVQINFKPCSRGKGEKAPKGNSRIYEEIWYRKTIPLGSKRHFLFDNSPHEQGIIVLRNIGTAPERVQIAANAVMRLLIDLQIKKMPVAVVAVPLEHYDRVASAFEYYRFARVNLNTETKMSGKQFHIRLQSYPTAHDECYYLQK
ncbi:MAG: hypothetical protein K2X77_15290 [Candidatus Obscuribacterales bacterium]|nr:hypothetical protein [Candidatus Obscuribacterales bacterium]